MKNVQAILLSFSVGLMTLTGVAQTNAPVTAPAPSDTGALDRPDENLSTATREVIQLANTKADKTAILNHVNSSTQPFQLTADDVIYLRDIGIDSDVVTAMLQHDVNNPAANAPAAPPTTVTNNPAVATAPMTEAPATPEVNSFYDALAPYGTWVTVPDHGLAWQPNVATTQPGWQPYSDAGNWLWTDDGWYWASDYSWGWAPFHYGGWWNSPSWGWCWFPGTTWAPSWCSWRTWGNFCGWAPLPPVGFGFSFSFGALPSSCFTFVNFNNFCNRNVHNHRIPQQQVNQFFHNTTVVNNFSRTRNNTVVNNGVSVDRVRQATGRALNPIPVRDSNPTQRANRNRTTQVTRDGQTVGVTRTVPPTLNQTAQGRTVRAQQLANNTPITPAVSQRLANTSRRHDATRQSIVSPNRPAQAVRPPVNQGNQTTRAGQNAQQQSAQTHVQTGPPVWNNQNRAVSPNERQLWTGSGREQSLTVPSQTTSRGEVPNRAVVPSEIKEPSGTSRNTGVPPTTPATEPRSIAPHPTTTPQTVAPQTPVPKVTSPQSLQQGTPSSVQPRTVTPSQPAVPRSSGAPTSPQPTVTPHSVNAPQAAPQTVAPPTTVPKVAPAKPTTSPQSIFEPASPVPAQPRVAVTPSQPVIQPTAPRSSTTMSAQRAFLGSPSPFVNSMRGQFLTTPQVSSGHSFQPAPSTMHSAPMHSGGYSPMPSGGGSTMHSSGGVSHSSGGSSQGGGGVGGGFGGRGR